MLCHRPRATLVLVAALFLLLPRAIRVLVVAHAHSLSVWVITLVSSLVLHVLAHAPNGAGGPSVVESSVGAISESDTKLGRVTVTYVPAPICLLMCVWSDEYPVLLARR